VLERVKLFCGNANRSLAEKVAASLNTRLGAADILRFGDGEIRVEIMEHVRGQQVFIMQPTCAPTNDNLMELLIMTDALHRSGAREVIAVIPYYGYARQDRRPGFSRVPITSRLVADMLEAAGIDYVIVVDIHSKQQQGFFKIPNINITTSPIITADIWSRYEYGSDDVVIVSPDVGGTARARSIAKQLDNANLAIVDKRRPEAGVAEVMNIIGDVNDKRCIVVDDMIDSAGTLCKAAIALKEQGAKSVAAYCTHPVFSGKAYENIASGELDDVVITDTIPLPKEFSELDKIRVLSVSTLIAETVRRIAGGMSVSNIYLGE